ncbi:hypothetical protein LTR08_001998 [Meristemomyces frigidus]|nr:hypothetical protein LTR08_001998 [Meristemomyces frigidus]
MDSNNTQPAPPKSHPDPDPFTTLLDLEDTFYTEGHTLGRADGSRAGRIEGRLFGLENSFQKAFAMGKLTGRANVWSARLAPPDSSGDINESMRLKPLPATARLQKQIARLAELTDPLSLDTRNSEDAVNEFDERVAGAKTKATLIAKIVGEDAKTKSSPSRESLSGEGGESAPTGKQAAKGTGEMEDFVGLKQAAQKATI